MNNTIMHIYAYLICKLSTGFAIIYTLIFFYRFMPTKQAGHKENRGGCIQHDEAYLLSI